MAGFVRRFRTFPTLEQLNEIEGIDIVDQTPPFPTTGVGTGTVVCIGEFEDGAFSVGGDATLFDSVRLGKGPTEISSSEDLRQRFGDFGFRYGALKYQNAAARRHLTELWNGNGFIKLKFLRFPRLIIARVDTSVGEVAFNMLACISGVAGPYSLTVGDSIAVTTDIGGPASSDVIAAVVATAAGSGFTTPTLFAGGEKITASIDGGPAATVTFTAADQLVADVVSRINLALGFTSAVVNVGEADISGIVQGTGGSVTLADVTAGTLAVIGHTAATTAGTGNVANATAITAAEIATIINASAALIAIDASAEVAQDGTLRVCSDTSGIGTVFVASGVMAITLGLSPLDTTVAAGTHDAGSIPAGTRVRNVGGDEWVTTQTLSVPAGTAASPQGGSFTVKVRPAFDDGTAAGESAAAVNVMVDQPAFGSLTVTNPGALTAALTEPQMDVVYESAIDATIDPNGIVQESTFSLAARQSDAVRAKLVANAEEASNEEHFGRKTAVSAPLGFTQTQAQTQVATGRLDRRNYTWPGWQTRITEIAEVGSANGLGFTDTGFITVRGDGPLTMLNAILAPEENPGQQTGLIEAFFAIEEQPTPLKLSSYIQLKAAGICAPRVDRVSGSVYQSGVTSVDPQTDPALVTQARRKMADFIQDSLAERLRTVSKKLNTADRRRAVRQIIESFLNGLQSPNNPKTQRIASFSVDETSGNTPELLAQGIFVIIIRVRTLSSLDKIVLQTEIGEAVTPSITELAA